LIGGLFIDVTPYTLRVIYFLKLRALRIDAAQSDMLCELFARQIGPIGIFG
jgi:hypothetical protein